MTDREKVLKGLECCIDPLKARCPECPYYPCYDEDTTSEKLLADSLKLLKAQEPAKPRYDRGYMDYNCPACGVYLLFHQKYCNECGKALKWDEYEKC